jgi:hypothetical protein
VKVFHVQILSQACAVGVGCNKPVLSLSKGVAHCTGCFTLFIRRNARWLLRPTWLTIREAIGYETLPSTLTVAIKEPGEQPDEWREQASFDFDSISVAATLP